MSCRLFINIAADFDADSFRVEFLRGGNDNTAVSAAKIVDHLAGFDPCYGEHLVDDSFGRRVSGGESIRVSKALGRRIDSGAEKQERRECGGKRTAERNNHLIYLEDATEAGLSFNFTTRLIISDQEAHKSRGRVMVYS